MSEAMAHTREASRTLGDGQTSVLDLPTTRWVPADQAAQGVPRGTAYGASMR
jgi:hypothetical protein